MTFYELESDGAAVVVEVVVDDLPAALVTYSLAGIPSIHNLLSTLLFLSPGNLPGQLVPQVPTLGNLLVGRQVPQIRIQPWPLLPRPVL